MPPALDHAALHALARDAGAAIMTVYRRDDVGLRAKEDRSPLTEADLASHRLIVDGLAALTPAIPVLSEESEAVDPAVRQGWSRFWLVDPLDGTKEFLRHNDEFTVNIALIVDAAPVVGVVYAPAFDRLWWAADGVAWRQDGADAPRRIGVAPPPAPGAPWRVVASRSHRSPATAAFLDELGRHECLALGSSLKLCAVADGTAHLAPRLGPTCEWDTAAADAVVRAAGGRVLAGDREGELVYNKPDLLNPWFLAVGDALAERFASWRGSDEQR